MKGVHGGFFLGYLDRWRKYSPNYKNDSLANWLRFGYFGLMGQNKPLMGKRKIKFNQFVNLILPSEQSYH